MYTAELKASEIQLICKTCDKEKIELIPSSLHLPLTMSNGYAYDFAFLKISKCCAF